MKAPKKIVALAARAIPGERVLALLLALFVAAGVVIPVWAAVPSEAQTVSTTYTVKDLGTLPGGQLSYAWGINDSGQVVGQADTSSGEWHAFLYSNGQMQDLGTLPGKQYGGANGINDSGQVVGYALTPSYDNEDTLAFLYSNGQMQDLGTLPGDTYSDAFGINDSGQVVGWSKTSSGEAHAFLYSNGQMQDLNSLIPAGSGWILPSALRINTSGQILGTGVINGQYRAFLATPDTPPSDTTPPRIISTVPKANAEEVAPTANVRATFSEDMQVDSVKNAFKLFKKGSTTQVVAVVSYDAATDKATLNPNNNLKRGATYKAVVTTVAKDMAGNGLDQDSFTSGLQQMRWFFRVDN